MKVTVRAFGPLQAALGGGRLEVETDPGATAGDLLRLLGERYLAEAHPELWDAGRCTFRIPVIVMSGNTDLTDFNRPLVDGQAIVLVAPMSGG